MKRVNFAAGLLFFVMILSGSSVMAAGDAVSVLSGNSLTELGDYQITELESETIGNETVRKFQIEYENGNAPVIVFLNERKRCNDFIVRSNVMEVQYVCKKSGFGATTITNSDFRMLPEQTNNMFLSQDALSRQEKIVNSSVSIEKALGLIACYYPGLLKNIQNISAN